jgi:hypothetical protein
MEGSQPVLRSDQKGMEEVQRIQEALAKGEPILSESQVELIKHQTAFLGEDAEAVMREIQEEATKTVRLPADIAKIIDNYCKNLTLRVGLRELSNDLEKDKERKRLMQLEAMEVEVNNFKAAKAQGNMAVLMRVKWVLSAQLKKYLEDIETDEGEGISSDVTGKWKRIALGLTKDATEYLSGIGRNVGAAEEDALGPLRRAIGRVATLGNAVTKGVSEPDEGELRDLAKKLGAVKRELMTLGRGLMVNQPPATATEAHELVSEAEEAIRTSQRTIKAALRGLGAASDTSEASSLSIFPLPQRPVMVSLAAPPPWPPQAEPPRTTSYGTGGELANLMRGLMGAQANDNGWPTFSGKYVEYPRFRKEWWAYRQMYHGHVRDELVRRSLKEKSLASSVRILVNDIEDLREAWSTLDTCFDRPEKYIAEALEPIIRFSGYKVFDNGAIREFYSLQRAAMMGPRRRVSCTDQTLPSILAKMPPNDWRQWAKERPMWMRGAVEEAFWAFVDQRWRDALNVAAAEPTGWERREQWSWGPRDRQERASRGHLEAAARYDIVAAAEGKPPQAEGGGCIFADVLRCSGRHPLGNAERSGTYEQKRGQRS